MPLFSTKCQRCEQNEARIASIERVINNIPNQAVLTMNIEWALTEKWQKGDIPDSVISSIVQKINSVQLRTK